MYAAGAPVQLGIVIEGESLLNDGAAIVLFNVLMNELLPGITQSGVFSMHPPCISVPRCMYTLINVKHEAAIYMVTLQVGIKLMHFISLPPTVCLSVCVCVCACVQGWTFSSTLFEWLLVAHSLAGSWANWRCSGCPMSSTMPWLKSPLLWLPHTSHSTSARPSCKCLGCLQWLPWALKSAAGEATLAQRWRSSCIGEEVSWYPSSIHRTSEQWFDFDMIWFVCVGWETTSSRSGVTMVLSI